MLKGFSCLVWRVPPAWKLWLDRGDWKVAVGEMLRLCETVLAGRWAISRADVMICESLSMKLPTDKVLLLVLSSESVLLETIANRERDIL